MRRAYYRNSRTGSFYPSPDHEDMMLERGERGEVPIDLFDDMREGTIELWDGRHVQAMVTPDGKSAVADVDP